MNKKAITSSLALILLGTLTVSASGGAFFWLSVVQEQIEMEEGLNIERFEVPLNDIFVVASDYNELNDEVTIYFENTGNQDLPIKSFDTPPTTIWLLKDQQNNVICSTDWSGNNNGPICKTGCEIGIEPEQVKRVVLTNIGPGSLCNIKDRVRQELLSFTIDLSGEAVAIGNLIR